MNRRGCLAGVSQLACWGWLQLGPPRVLGAAGSDSAANGQSPTQFLPLFPLGIVAFPGEPVLLHIFEPRYKQLITECAQNGMTFGIVTVVPGGASSIGTEMRLERIVRTDEKGNLDVATLGVRVFQLKSFQRDVEGKLYSGGQVLFMGNNPRIEPQVQADLVNSYNRMVIRAGATRNMVAPYPENLSFVIAHDVGLSTAQKLQLLTMPEETDRQKYLLRHISGTY